MKPRGLITASFITLGIFATYNAFADGQSKIDDPKKAAKDIFWDELYPNGGKSFFCEQPFEGKTRRIVAGHIYNTQWMLDHYDCGTKSRCRKSNTDYKYAASDLHNLYPVSPRVELNRRNSKYSELPNRSDQFPNLNCSYKSAFQSVEPADEIKGNIARVIFYMNKAYNLPILGSSQMLLEWNEQDPVDQAEIDRNNLVEKIQGTRNRFIDNPHAIKDLDITITR
ncbi:endonuclease [Litoribacillus peritrichatus]|uniref:Endonuclease I n=1 Tax=Litoribacillus peritrichatus TaxID=718191 RepID=A0ABP7LW77_9GAMM